MNIEDILPPGYASEGTSPISDTPPFPITASLTGIPIPPASERVPFGNPPSKQASSARTPQIAARGITSLSAPTAFTPSSYITTVRKGALESGELVGEFEMGLTSKLKPSTVCVRGQEALLRDILDDSKRDVASILWKGQSGHLFWDDNSITKKCYRTEHCRPFELLAQFSVPNRLRQLGDPAECTQLRIYPEGQEHFDDILISILVLERKRTTLAVKDEAMLASSSILNPMRTLDTPSPPHDVDAESDVGGPSRRRRWHYTAFPPFGEGGDYNAQLHSL
ncbi:hypothetical protein F5146DRAFT_1136515 [Armillaria mellea]|nr:hypothetical protein F5146DRAFT_1136515 [Armillaria mellea]